MNGSATELTVRIDDQQRTLTQGQVLTIGRAVDCDWSLDDRRISRWHASVQWREGWYVTDLESANGTYVDGREVSEIRVDGDLSLRLADPVDGLLVSLQVVATEPARLNLALPSPASAPPLADDGSRTRILSASEGRTIVIGRDPSADVVIVDPLLSRQHCKVIKSGSALVVIDLDSRNGTYVNGVMVDTAVLAPGDQLTIGNTDIDIDIDQSGALVVRSNATRTGLVLRSVSYATAEGKVLVADVNVNAPPGMVIGVIGPSGAGKSTLMNVITGLREPASGTAWFEGHDVHAEHTSMKTRIGFVPQDNLIHRQLSVRQAFHYAARLRLPADTDPHEYETRVQAVIDLLGLSTHQDTPIKKLSGGECKRASIGLELITQPALLVLDEPTSGLDPNTARDLLLTLRDLADRGRTVVVVSHSPADLDQCDIVVLLAAGGLVAGVGPPDGVLAQFQTTDWRDVYHDVSTEGGNPVLAHSNYLRASAYSALSNPPPISQSARRAPPFVGPSRKPKQLRTLVRRQWRLLSADRGYFVFLLVLPLALGGLAFVAPGETGFGELLEARQILVVLICGASFAGLALSVRDLVAERSIYQRERAVGLRPTAYIGSKIVVFGLVGVLQAAILTAVVLSRKPAPTSPLLLGNGGLEIFVAVLLTLWCSCAFGLLISSLVRTNEQVLPVVVLSIMLSLVFSGGMIPISGRAVLTQIAWFIPSRWGYSAAADTIDLQALANQVAIPPTPTGAPQPPPDMPRPQFTEPDLQFDHLTSQWLKSAAILILLGLAFVLLTLWRVRDKKHKSRGVASSGSGAGWTVSGAGIRRLLRRPAQCPRPGGPTGG